MPKREKDLIDEIHEWRADLLAKCDNDLEKLGKHLRQKESEHPHRVVNQITYKWSGNTAQSATAELQK